VGKAVDFDEPVDTLGMEIHIVDITIPAPIEKLPEPTAETIAKGKEILKKSLAAMGGPAITGIKDIDLVGKQVQVTPMGEFSMDSEIKTLRPTKLLAQMKTPMGDMTMVFDGTNAWLKGPNGTQDLPGSQRTEMLQQLYADIHYILQNFEKGDYGVQFLKDETVDGKMMNIVLIHHLPSKANLQLTVDSKSGFIVKKISRQSGQNGPVTVEESYSDYRLADGIQFPFKTVGTREGKKISELSVTSIKVNTGLKEEAFTK
jgi:hypothetical protein